MPHDAVDVNVHPTKAEVRFRDQSYIHSVIRRTLGDALGRGPAPELTLEAPQFRPQDPFTLPLPASYGTTFPSRWTTERPVAPFAPQGSQLAPQSEAALAPSGDASLAPSGGTGIAPTGDVHPMIPLGQFRDTFIIAVDQDGIAIIDQHVAHERVLFERITERLTTGRLESQRLLDPILIEMPAGARQALISHAADLDRLGFEIEEFGGETLRVSAFPALLRREECDVALRALSEDLEGLDRGAKVDDAIKRIAATMACHAAVKANYPLTHEKMLHILDELRRTAYSTICPHGRPVMLRLTRREVEKNFHRI
jgi:DNA mismatch repair protein MutL